LKGVFVKCRKWRRDPNAVPTGRSLRIDMGIVDVIWRCTWRVAAVD
jgi:hypothetical protein